MLLGACRAQELSFYPATPLALHNNNSPKALTSFHNSAFSVPMHSSLFSFSSSLSLLRSLTLSLSHHHHYHHHRLVLRYMQFSPHTRRTVSSLRTLKLFSTSAEQLACQSIPPPKNEEKWDLSGYSEHENDIFKFDGDSGYSGAGGDLKHLDTPALEVKELEELPEQWRRARLAWLCKQLPAHKAGTLVKILNAQKKWMRQEDATYVAVHCMRIRENDAAFRVYKWMMQQHWYRFDFALATKLADYMGKERKFAKCREIYDDIINQGRVPSESTFHILIIAYLSAPVQGCLEEACTIYNRMIQMGGYQPRLSLHNSLFRALVSKPGGFAKHYLKQAEFIYHNVVTSGLEVQKDIYGGLIWLHSYQDSVDKERIASIRVEMKQAGIEEGREILVSILRACSKDGDVEEAERVWLKILKTDGGLPTQAFVYKMEVFAKLGEHMRSLEIFREMQERLGSASVSAYHKIIEVLSGAQEVELAESLLQEFIKSDQFWPKGCPTVPKLIHRWLSPQVLAFWYMYGGHRTSSGDILLKLKGNREGVEKVVKTLKSKSLNFKVKRRARIFWIGFLGNDSVWFWKLVEPYILDDLKIVLKAGDQTGDCNAEESQEINFDGSSDTDYSDDDHS